MRRMIGVLLTATLTAGLMAASSPARAEAPDWPLSCAYELPSGPGFQSVYFDSSGRLIINPEAAPGDAVAWALWSPDAALALAACLAAPLPLEGVACAYQKLTEIAGSVDPLNTNLRYVYPNPEGPGYAVDYQLLIGDASALVGCA